MQCQYIPRNADLHARLTKRAARKYGASSIRGARWVVAEYKAQGGGYKRVCRKAPKRKKRKALGYPPQPCGLTYDKFRGGWTYQQAYEQIAFQENRKGVTQKAVRFQMRKLKEAEYDQYLQNCEYLAEHGPKHKRVDDCCRICRAGKPCGKGCIPKLRSCRRPATCGCSIDEVQITFDFSEPARDADRFGYSVSEFQDAAGLGRSRRRKRRK